MLTFFPTPYPDELMYSVFARYHKASGNISHVHTLEELFGTKSALPTLEFPSRLTYLCSNLPSGNIYKEEYYIYGHTIFPFYKPFIPSDRAIDVIKDMKGNKGNAIHMRLGIMAAGICKTRSLKVCTSCKSEDQEIYGEAYFHRIHQVPGNYFCSKHKEILKEYSIPYITGDAEFININNIETSSLVENDLKSYYEKFYELSKDIEFVILNIPRHTSISNVYKKYSSMLNKKGYLSPKGRVKHKRLREYFTEYYDEHFLELLESNIEENNRENWLLRIAARDNQVIHPLRHLLFIRFLFGSMNDFINEENQDYHSFGKSPWPCLNTVASHYKKDVITVCEISRDSKTGRPVGKFICDCGFIYSRRGPDINDSDRYRIGNKKQFGRVWEDKLKELVLSNRMTVKQISKELSCDEKTLVKYAKKLNLGAFSNTNIKPYPDKKVNSRYHKELEFKYKDDILNLLNKYPSENRKQIRGKAEKQYSWLFKYRRSWMEEVLPKPLESSLKLSKKVLKVDWKLRDDLINDKVKNAINELLNEEKPRRITISVIKKMIDYRPIYEHLEKLPKTKLTLDQNIESVEEFQIRRLNLVIKNLLERDINITKNKIIRLAGLSRRSNKVEELMKEMLDKYNK